MKKKKKKQIMKKKSDPQENTYWKNKTYLKKSNTESDGDAEGNE